MTLHWIRVRRARGLPMPLPLPLPLPPKPKRPLGPPVLFNWHGVDIRTRADIEATGTTWDEFLDSVAANDDLRMVSLTTLVLRLVPDNERQDLNWEIRRRYMDRRESEAAREAENRKRIDEIAASRSWIPEWLRRA